MPDEASINEAELEARLAEAIRRLFPSLDQGRISHQKILKLKLGHRAIKIDGTKVDTKKGRLDILLELDGLPLAILELKRPSEPLDGAVSQQGLSYARLLDDTHLPPLVITSNGTDSQFFKTWDASPWTAHTPDEKAIQTLFAQAGKAAAEDLDRAVQHLLDSVPDAWTEALSRFSLGQIDSLTGAIDNLRKPIASDFFIPRVATVVLHAALSRGYRKIALTGDPLSGKTNALAGLCRTEHLSKHCFLYVDLATSSEGVFDRIASAFTKEFFKAFTKEQVRTWILNQLPRHPESKLAVVVDGIDAVETNLVRQDLDALATMANNGHLSLILAGHPESVEALAVVKGRNIETALGAELVKLPLTPLNDEEFDAVRKICWNTRRAVLDLGSDKVIELRQPRLLRLLLSKVPLAEAVSEAQNDEPADNLTGALILTTPNPRWFSEVWRRYTTDGIRDDYRRLAEAVLKDSKNPGTAEEGLRFAAFSALRVETVEGPLSEERLRSLRERGFLQFIYRGNGSRFYLPKLPELLAAALADLIADRAIHQESHGEVEAVAEYIIEEAHRLPYGAMIAALAILRASERPGFEFTVAVATQALLEMPPHFQKFSEDTKMAAYGPNGTPIAFSLADLHIPEEEQGTWDNTEPWFIVLYLLTQPLAGGDEGTARINAIEKIGSHPSPLVPMSPLRTVHHLMIEEHEFPGGMRLPHGSSAFLEPVIELIRLAVSEHPQELTDLVDRVHGNLPLLFRLINGIRHSFHSSRKEEADLAAKLLPILDKKFDEAFKETIKLSGPIETMAPDTGATKEEAEPIEVISLQG